MCAGLSPGTTSQLISLLSLPGQQEAEFARSANESLNIQRFGSKRSVLGSFDTLPEGG